MSSYRKLSEQDGPKLQSWWQYLQDNRGERAQLRRCRHPDDALLTTAFARFLQKMPPYWGVRPGAQGIGISDAATVACLLARVKTDSKLAFAKALAQPQKEGGQKAAMSELRFQQLQKSRTEEEFFTRICRAIDLLGGKVGLISLADSVLQWLHEYRFAPAARPQDRLAVKWACDYYDTFRD